MVAGFVHAQVCHLRSGRAACCGMLICLWAGVGCSSLGRQQQRDNVVQARQTALRGMDAAQAGQWDVAERLYRQAVDICPVDERARRGFAETLWQRGQRDQAIQQMQEAARLAGDEATMLVRLGEMYLATGDLQRAELLADQAVGSGRAPASAYQLKGNILRHNGAWREALASYHKALSVQPDFPEVQMAVARLYLEHQRPQRALSTMQAMADQYPVDQQPANVLYWQGVVLKSLERYAQAADCFALADERGLHTADLLYQLAETRYRTGDLAQAQLALQRARQLDPTHPVANSLATSIEESRVRMAIRPR
jgi:tetratricopeptide (TPR) repeat protein